MARAILVKADNDKMKFLMGRNLRHLRDRPEFHGFTSQDLFMLMKTRETTFCLEYIRTDGNASQAAFIAVYAGNYEHFKSEKARQQACSSAGYLLLKSVLVSCYLYKKKAEMLDKYEKKMARTFDAYVAKIVEIRDGALKNKDYSAALRAAMQVGIIYGHSEPDSQSVQNRSDMDLVRDIAGSNTTLVKLLSEKMGLKEEVAIEGELVEPLSVEQD